MFEQSLLNQRSERRPVAVLLSLILQVGLLTLALLAPLVFIDALPGAQLATLFVLPPLPVARPAEVPKPLNEAVPRVKVKRGTAGVFTAPSQIPKKVAQIVEEIEVDPHLLQLAHVLPAGSGTGPAIANGVPGLDQWFKSAGEVPAPPPSDQKAQPKEVIRIRRGGSVVEALAISRPAPPYPELARRARVEGDVHLNAVIGVDGRIRELRLQSGHALLARAAIEAVSQWRYQPTTLNGDPVEVVTQITVTFRLR